MSPLVHRIASQRGCCVTPTYKEGPNMDTERMTVKARGRPCSTSTFLEDCSRPGDEAGAEAGAPRPGQRMRPGAPAAAGTSWPAPAAAGPCTRGPTQHTLQSTGPTQTVTLPFCFCSFIDSKITSDVGRSHVWYHLD